MVLSICIVNWNTRELLRACLRSLAVWPPAVSHEILVADNASADGSAAMVAKEFPNVRLFANDANLGYAAGNNQLLRAARGHYLLLLNSDVEILPELEPAPLDKLCAYLDREPFCGAVAARLVHPDEQTQRSCRGFPEPVQLAAEWTGLARLFPRQLGRYRMHGFDHQTSRDVDQPMASCLLLRRAALARVGLIDERFRIFFNDVDLCWRLWQAGWRVHYLASAAIRHHGGASTRQVRPAMVVESREALLAYLAKHRPAGRRGWAHTALALAVRVAFWLRLALARWRG